MSKSGYFLTITKPNGSIEKRYARRLPEINLILAVSNWRKAEIEPIGHVEHREERNTKKRPVVCVETGETFQSIKDCAKHFGLPYKAIWNSMVSGTSRNGMHFKDADSVSDE